MSRLLEHFQQRRASGGSGFTVIELIVAITLLGIVAAAAIPLLIIGAKAANAAKLHTQAKNLSQQRLESMRDMQFHVDRQNGPFVDMLDVYYTDAKSSAGTVTRTRGAETMQDTFFSDTATSNGSATRTSSDPSAGPFYKVYIAQLPGYPQFSQTIDTQFLNLAGQAVAGSTFSGYDSQTEGADAPPTLMVGVTVTTSWQDHGSSHSYSNYTRITDTRGTQNLITSQGIGELIRLTSAAPDGTSVTMDVAQARADGNLTTGSTATAEATTVKAVDESAGSPYTGAYGLATSPGNSSSTPPAVTNLSSGGSGCGLVTAASTQVGNISAATASGLPKVPSNVDTASPPANQVTAQLMANNSGTSHCGMWSFGNDSTSYDSGLMLDTDYPLVRLPNVGGIGVVGQGSAWVSATTDQSLPHYVTSGAGASSSQPIQIFPSTKNLSWITDGKPLLEVTLNSASLSCSSKFDSSGGTSGVTQTATASWSATIDLWTTSGRRWVTSTGTLSPSATTISWSSGATSTDPLAALPPSSIPVYTNNGSTLYLSNWISSWSTAQAIADSSAQTQTSGVHTLNSIVGIGTQPVRGAADPLSAVGIQIGNLSCAAEDNR